MADHLPPTTIGQTGHVPRVEINAPLGDEQELTRPNDVPEMPEPHSTTGRFKAIHDLLTEGTDDAKTADDSVKGSADPAVAAR